MLKWWHWEVAWLRPWKVWLRRQLALDVCHRQKQGLLLWSGWPLRELHV